MSALWFGFILYCGFHGAEITDLNLLMIAVFYIGDCILIKSTGDKNGKDTNSLIVWWNWFTTCCT